MKKRLTRILTVAAALTLALSATNAAAEGSEPWNRKTIFTTRYTEPEVNVIVPTTGLTFLNPYGSAVQVNGEEEDGQVISLPSSIANLSVMPLQVDVTVSGQVQTGSSIRLATSSTKEMESRTKYAFLYFEMKNVGASAAESPDSVQWDGSYDEGTDLIVTKTKRTLKNMVTLSGANADGSVSANGSAAFHLDGDAIKNPKIPWNDKDGVQVTVSFSFKPLPYS